MRRGFIGVIGGGFAAADHPKPLLVKALYSWQRGLA